MQLRDSPAAAVLAAINRELKQTGHAGYAEIQQSLLNKKVDVQLLSLRVYVQRLRNRKLIKTEYWKENGQTFAYFKPTKKGQSLLKQWRQLIS